MATEGTRRRGRAVTAAVTAVGLVGASAALGAFGTNGRVITDFGGVNSADAVAIARDGKIVAAGNTTANGTFDFAVARYRKGGGLDNSFNGSGRLVDDLNGGFESTRAVRALRHGKILLAGVSDGGFADDQGTLVRYRKNGSRDSSFSGDGVAQYVVVGGSDFQDVARHPGGGYVAVGNQGDQMVIVRFRESGALNSGFGNGTGARLVQMNDVTRGLAVAIQRNGKIVVGGETKPGGMVASRHAAFVRLRPNGRFDKSFSKDGRRIVKLPLTSGRIEDVAVRGKKIYAAGFASKISAIHPVLIRLRNNGGRDKKFAGKGRKLHKYGANARINAIGFQGKRLVGAGRRDDPVADFFVARFKQNGGKDKTFSKDGWNATNIDGGDSAQDLAIQKNKRIVLAGGSGGTEGFVLVRYKKNGAVDK